MKVTRTRRIAGGQCGVCNGDIKLGEQVTWGGINAGTNKRTVYHAACTGGRAAEAKRKRWKVRTMPGTCEKCQRILQVGEYFVWGTYGEKGWNILCAPNCTDGAKRADETKVEQRDQAEALGATTTGTTDDTQQIKAAAWVSVQAEKLAELSTEVESLKAIIAEVSKSREPLTIEIVRKDLPTITVENAHATMPRLLKRLVMRKHVYLWGPPGSGKSTAAKKAAEALGLRYGYAMLDPKTPNSQLFGFMDLNPGGSEKLYRGTPFFECYTQGGVFCIDELDNGPASMLTLLNGLLENGDGAFPHGIFPRHPDFVLVGTGNTNGKGADVLFPERRVFDSAFAERFCFIEWTYDLLLEERITMSRNPNAGPWLKWTRDAREYCRTNKVRQFFSPRCAFVGAELLAEGGPDNTVDLVAEEVGFRGLATDVKQRILSAHPLPRVSMMVQATVKA